jgi:hypothetical protein
MLHDLGGRATAERRGMGQQLVEDHADAIEVRSRGRELAADHLGGHVLRRSRDHNVTIGVIEPGRPAIDPCESEVDHRDVIDTSERLHEKVLALDVGVNDPAAVGRIQRAQDLQHDLDRTRHRDQLLADDPTQRPAAQMLHRDVRRAIGEVVAVEDHHRAWVAHAARCDRLVAARAATLAAGHSPALQELDDHRASELGLIRNKHRPHAAIGDVFPQDILATESITYLCDRPWSLHHREHRVQPSDPDSSLCSRGLRDTRSLVGARARWSSCMRRRPRSQR